MTKLEEIADMQTIEPFFNSVFTKARRKFLEHKRVSSKISKTCAANMMHNDLVERAKQECKNNGNIKVGKFNGIDLILFCINGREYQITLKKVNKKFETRNFKTIQNELFKNCKEIPGLLPSQIRLNFGYQADEMLDPKCPMITSYQDDWSYPITSQIEEKEYYNHSFNKQKKKKRIQPRRLSNVAWDAISEEISNLAKNLSK